MLALRARARRRAAAGAAARPSGRVSSSLQIQSAVEAGALQICSRYALAAYATPLTPALPWESQCPHSPCKFREDPRSSDVFRCWKPEPGRGQLEVNEPSFTLTLLTHF